MFVYLVIRIIEFNKPNYGYFFLFRRYRHNVESNACLVRTVCKLKQLVFFLGKFDYSFITAVLVNGPNLTVIFFGNDIALCVLIPVCGMVKLVTNYAKADFCVCAEAGTFRTGNRTPFILRQLVERGRTVKLVIVAVGVRPNDCRVGNYKPAYFKYLAARVNVNYKVFVERCGIVSRVVLCKHRKHFFGFHKRAHRVNVVAVFVNRFNVELVQKRAVVEHVKHVVVVNVRVRRMV